MILVKRITYAILRKIPMNEKNSTYLFQIFEAEVVECVCHKVQKIYFSHFLRILHFLARNSNKF